MSIDIKVFQTFGPYARAAPILAILAILAILLQTAERARGTGPRTTASPPKLNARSARTCSRVLVPPVAQETAPHYI